LPDLYAIAEDERKRLFERDAAVLARIKNLYGGTLAEINKEIATVTGQLQALQRGEGDVKRTTGLLARELKAKQWLRNVEGRLAALAAPAAGFVAWHQGEASKLGEESIIRAGNKQLGTVAVEWNKLQTEAMEAFAGFAGDGSPLKKIFRRIGPETAKEMEDVLFKGIGLGKNPMQTGRELRQAASISSIKAQTIARTETIRAYRETQHLSLNENDDVLEGWVWTASKSERSCASCLAMDGTFHKLEERMNSHPNCRCVAVPLTKGIEQVTGRKGLGETRVELGETGTEWFKKQGTEAQDFILGPKGGRAYRKGDVKLENFVAKVRDEDWGDYFTRAPLRDALKGGGAHPGFAIPPIVKKRKRAPKGLPPANVIEPPVSIPTPAPVPQIVPGTFKDIAEAEAGMETLYPNIKFDFTDAHIDAINPTAAQFHKLAQDWPEVAARFQYIGTYGNKTKIVESGHSPDLAKDRKGNFDGEIAHAFPNGKRMGLNPKFFSDPAAFLKEMERGEQSGFFAPGGNKIEYVMTHEFGHMVDFWLRDVKYNYKFKFAVDNNETRVSHYAKENDKEAFAETFAGLEHWPFASLDNRHPHVKTLAGILAEHRPKIRKPDDPKVAAAFAGIARPPQVGDLFRSTEPGRKTVWANVLLLQVIEVSESGVVFRRLNTAKPGMDMSKGGRRTETPESFVRKMQGGIIEPYK
jgi:SPP1 gp7 family putative phage head morphogenesis protein